MVDFNYYRVRYNDACNTKEAFHDFLEFRKRLLQNFYDIFRWVIHKWLYGVFHSKYLYLILKGLIFIFRIFKIHQILHDIRETAFNVIQQKLHCRRGVNYSPLYAYRCLVQNEPHQTVRQLWTEVQYAWSMSCTQCTQSYNYR